jgi:GNAT superfamily N-acetyltransferase
MTPSSPSQKIMENLMTHPANIPGTLSLAPGVRGDYDALSRFHYIREQPRTWALIWTARYAPPTNSRWHGFSTRVDLDSGGRTRVTNPCRKESDTAPRDVVAVAVLSWPQVFSHGRDAYFDIRHLRLRDKLNFINANVRTISRVIVHPQFRSLGLATALVRCLCDHCPTRYVETSAQMARGHPLFDKAGMARVTLSDPDKPVYYVWDRDAFPSLPSGEGRGEGAPHGESHDKRTNYQSNSLGVQPTSLSFGCSHPLTPALSRTERE